MVTSNWRAYLWIWTFLQLNQKFIKNVYKSIGPVSILMSEIIPW